MLKKMSPTVVLILGFLLIILLGAFLLSMPFSSASGEFTSPLTSLFTATSATCVTGLAVVDTGVYWSETGKGIILLLIQVGGLGFMSLALIFSVLLRRRVSPKAQLVFAQSMNLDSGDKLITFVKRMILFAFSAEAVGAVLLSLRFVPLFGAAKGITYGIFHSVSAFCNAGFDILGGQYGEFVSLEPFANDPLVLLTVAFLIISGGLGFLVWNDIYLFFKKRSRISVYSKIVLCATGFLLVSGTVFFALTEWSNPLTIGGADSNGGKILQSFFQSATLRTAGFSAFSQGAMSELSKMVCMLFMFVGGASGSTAGGIKVGTFVITLVAAVSFVRGGDRDINFFKRRFDSTVVNRAFSLVTVGFGVVLLAGCAILQLDGYGLSDSLYEVFSAFGTVGLSTGITPSLSVASKLILTGLMFFGRIGIISIMYAVMSGSDRDNAPIRYAKAQMPVG